MTLTTIYDNGLNGDRHFMLEENADGLLYETSNAVTRALVCSAMFAGWGIEQEPRSTEWKSELAGQFDSEEVAERYYRAATDQDK